MNPSLFISIASIASALLCSGFAFTLSRGPGWRDLRWFGWICFSGAGYVFGTLPENGVGPDAWVPVGSSLALASGAGHMVCWFFYLAAIESRALRGTERAIVVVLAACGVAACVPGLLLGGPVTDRPNAWFPGVHRDATPTALGWVVFLTYLGAFVALIVHMFRAAVEGTRRMWWPASGLSLVAVATVHDTLASARVYPAPSLTELAIFGMLVSVLLGITARAADDARALVRSRAELERTQAELVDRERLAALGELSAVVAHEVRNPLAVIYGAIATLQRTAESDETKNALALVRHEAERLNQVVSDLLQLARPTTPRIAETRTQSLLEDAMRAAVRAAGHEPDEVKIAIGEGAEVLECDPAMMHHAVTNLVMNALQAEGRRGPVELRARSEDDRLRISVSDDGKGVPAEDVARLFTPFFTTRAQGTGLGLALVAKVAKGHGGHAKYEDTGGGGATFVLEVPRTKP